MDLALLDLARMESMDCWNEGASYFVDDIKFVVACLRGIASVTMACVALDGDGETYNSTQVEEDLSEENGFVVTPDEMTTNCFSWSIGRFLHNQCC